MYSKHALTPLLLAACTLLLSGCLAQSQIQAKYMNRETDCREEAQQRVMNGQASGLNTLGYDNQMETAYVLASGFSECMNRSGWKVATPKTPPANTASNTQPPYGAPGPGGVVGAAKAPPPAGTVVGQQPAPAAAPQPAMAPAARPAIVQGTTAQPGYGRAGYVPEYGTGPGRQF